MNCKINTNEQPTQKHMNAYKDVQLFLLIHCQLLN